MPLVKSLTLSVPDSEEYKPVRWIDKLAYDDGGTWRAWSLFTTLEELHGWPDGRPRDRKSVV